MVPQTATLFWREQNGQPSQHHSNLVRSSRKSYRRFRKDEEEEENAAENVNQNEEDNQNDTVEGEGEGEEEEEEESEQLGTKIKR